MLELEEPFPTFRLPAHDGSTVSSVDLRGAPHLVFYLPKPKSRASQAQLAGFREHWPAIQKAGLTVYGVTYDEPDKNRALAQEARIPFLLLSDARRTLAEAADAKAWIFPFPARMSFLMRPDGAVAKIYLAVRPASHAEDVLQDLRELG